MRVNIMIITMRVIFMTTEMFRVRSKAQGLILSWEPQEKRLGGDLTYGDVVDDDDVDDDDGSPYKDSCSVICLITG